MKLSQFQKQTKLIVLISIVLIIILGWLGETKPPSVTHADLVGQINSAAFVDQRIDVEFSRPMVWEMLKLDVQPAIDFKLYWSNNKLSIVFPEPLLPETDYKLTIDSESAGDIYNNYLVEDFEYSFTTKPRRLAFVDKSLDNDRIILATDQLEQIKVLYQSSKIKMFRSTQDVLIVVDSNSDQSDTLKVVDLNSGEEDILESGAVNITNIDLSIEANQLLYIVQPVELIEDIAIPSDGHTMKLFDLSDYTTRVLKPPFEVEDYRDVRFSDDGLGAVFRVEDGTYFLMDIHNPELNVSLGRHIAMSNFSKDGNQLIMLDQPLGDLLAFYPQVLLVDNNRSTELLFDGSEFIIDPRFLNTKDSILYAKLYKEHPASKGLFEILSFDPITREETRLLSDKNSRSLEYPIPSPDDRLIVIERYTNQDLNTYEDLRSIEFQTKPPTADLIVLDSDTLQIIDRSIRGVDAMWIE